MDERYTVLNMSIQKTMLLRLSGIALAVAGLGLLWFQQAGLRAQQPPKQPPNPRPMLANSPTGQP